MRFMLASACHLITKNLNSHIKGMHYRLVFLCGHTVDISKNLTSNTSTDYAVPIRDSQVSPDYLLPSGGQRDQG